MPRRSFLAFGWAFTFSVHAACPLESQLSHIRRKGVEISGPLTVVQVEALTETGPNGMRGIKPYSSMDPEWQKLKAEQRDGDYYVQFWRGRRLVERTKFYMDGLYLVRRECVVGWLKGTVS